MSFPDLKLERKARRGREEGKSRVFSVRLLGHLAADSLWEPAGSAGACRPVWIAYHGSDQEARAFTANFRAGRKAASGSDPFQVPKRSPHRWTVQRVAGGVAVGRRAANLPARLAEHLAAVLAPALPHHDLIRSVVRGRVARRRLERPARVVRPGTVRSFLATYLSALARRFRESRGNPNAPADGFFGVTAALPVLARAIGAVTEARTALEVLLEEAPQEPRRYWGPTAGVREALARLAAAESVEDGAVVPPEHGLSGRARRELVRALETLHEAAKWEESAPCGEPLFQATPNPRRYPLARVILRRHRRRFGLIVADEAHELNHADSAQSRAAHRLTGLPGVPTIVLTGSLMGGYASSLFANFWALSPAFREEFGRGETRAFVDRYGFRKTLRDVKHSDEPGRRGAQTDRDLDGRKVLGEAPGVLSTFVLRHLLPTAVLVHKEDLEAELPPLIEEPVALAADPEDVTAAALVAEYGRLQSELLRCIGRDRFVPDRAGRLLGALVELPSYLDRAADDLPPFELRYPESLDREWIATGKAFPAGWRSPKERWLLDEVRTRVAGGEKVLVFLRHTGTPDLPRRLARLLREVTPRVAWLDAGKVPTHRREAWIDEHVLASDVEVLLVNPNAVRTGLNNLVAFSAGVWYELDPSATTYRQANGRLHRIGQTRPVTILTPYYPGTAQETMLELVAKKVSASLQVDGLDLQAALEAAGASDDETASVATAMSLGQAVYERLVGRG